MYILYIFLLIILIIYIYSYYIYPTNITILQTNLDKLNYNMLLERQPLIIENTKTDIYQLQDTLFYLMSSTYFDIDASDIWHNNNFKYIVLQSINDEKSEILIYPPFKKMINNSPDPNETLMNIELKKGQILILPFHWKYYIQNDYKFKCLGVHNLITYILPK